MATNGNAWAQQSDTHTGEVLRGFAAAVFGLPMAAHANSTTAATTRLGSYGVVGPPTALEATITSGLNWSVNEGYVVAPGTFAKGQGCYVGYNNGAKTGTLTAHSAFIRHDLVCYRVRDTDVDATTFEDDDIVVLQGTTASTDPSIAAGVGTLVPLARFVVPATSGTVTVADLRQRATAIGGTAICTSTTRPTGAALFEGKHIFEIDTNRTYKNTSATTTASWVPVSGRFGCSVYHSGFLVPASTVQTYGYDTETYDTDNYWSGGTNIVVPAGLGAVYSISCYAHSNTSTAVLSNVYVLVGGTIVGVGNIPVGGGSAAVSIVRALNAGDIITVQVANGHTSAVTFDVTTELIRISE